MRVDSGYQQVAIIRPLPVDLVIDDDLVLRLLQFHLAELVGLAGLALADDFGRWFEHAEKLAFTARIATEHARPGLLHHLSDQWHHLIELRPQAFQRHLIEHTRRLLHAFSDFRGEAVGLPHHPARRVQQQAIALLQLVLIYLSFRARDPSDLQQTELHTAAPIAQLGSDRAGNLCDLPD